MRSTTFAALTLAALMTLPVTVCAQSASNTAEYLGNEYEIKVDKAQISRDQREIREFESAMTRMYALDATSEAAEYARICERLLAAMQREHQQAGDKVERADREVGQSRREVRIQRQEASATGNLYDYRQLQDDRYGVRDDRRDQRAAFSRSERMSAILIESSALEVAISEGDTAAMTRNGRLAGEFLELMRADLRATATELSEYRRERVHN